ncbi:ABC transporter substrate-binding protein [Marichromatium purpuratum 984]|uniref:ABC transporter substrate-binding protein n=1 Tax=Marichromatium purpuratum 984 TaxID=765910 RepID=W0E2Z8_MARPU|nr:ABC transporter substrate-binding protein [Marichromatium purpuratum 984]
MSRFASRVRHIWVWCLPLVVLCWHPSLVAAPAPSVASTNLCADLLLLAVADPRQIRSVSVQSQRPGLPRAALAERYPGNRGRVEELLHLKPDVALVYSGWGGRRHAGLLAERGVRLIELPYPRDWDDSLETARTVAATIGRAAAGAALAVEARGRMRALAGRLAGRRALYLRPSGGSAGAGTYVDGLMRHLGLVNLAAEAGHRGWGRFPLERLVSDPPDLFLLGYFDRRQPPSASTYARHPLFREQLARIPAVRVPGDAWGCGGLELVAAAEAIVAAVEALPSSVGGGR